MAWNKSQRKYASSEKGKQSRLRYQKSVKGIEAHKRYMAKRRAKLAEAKQLKATTIVEPVKTKVEGSKMKKGAAMSKS
jgi:hypothetical protein